MKDPLLITIRKFLEPRLSPGKPVLLGYSGGPDSKALLHLLLECRRFFSFDLQLAHVDHGWREESRQQALGLQNEAEILGLPFHLKTLVPEQFMDGNLEEQGRVFRLEFFSELYHRAGCQALALGHHADDQAEVVLKRIFEGASLFSLGGLAQEKSIQGMNLWRPLLEFQKKAILDWLEKRNLNFIVDPTNLSSQNLRGRMRQDLLPSLSRSFGKEITANLYSLGEESRQLKQYFSNLNQPLMKTLQLKSNGFCWDLNPFFPLPALQLKYLLKERCSQEGIVLSRQILEDIVTALLECRMGKKFLTRHGMFQIDHGHLSFNKNDCSS